MSTPAKRARTLYILNFSHPLMPGIIQQLSPCAEIHVPFNLVLDFPQKDETVAQVTHIVNEAERELKTKYLVALNGTVPIAIVLPGISEGVAILLAELHGRMGNFPLVLGLRKDQFNTYQLRGLLDLDKCRLNARGRRNH